MQNKLRMMEIQHKVFVAVVDPKPGMRRMMELTAMMMVACHSSLSSKHSHLCLQHSTYQGCLGFGLCNEIIQKFIHVHPTYKAIAINIFEAFDCWNPVYKASQERRLVIFAPLAQ